MFAILRTSSRAERPTWRCPSSTEKNLQDQLERSHPMHGLDMRPVRLAHFSDIHITTPGLQWEREDSLRTSVWRRGSIFDCSVAAFASVEPSVSCSLSAPLASRTVDKVVFSGDATAMGFEAEVATHRRPTPSWRAARAGRAGQPRLLHPNQCSSWVVRASLCLVAGRRAGWRGDLPLRNGSVRSGWSPSTRQPPTTGPGMPGVPLEPNR